LFAYTITSEERKIFLKLPPSERKSFMDEFWKRRDPLPGTATNEFKEEYLLRLEQANKFFGEGGKQGWLSDRGRIWITLGPPDHRETYPGGRVFMAFRRKSGITGSIRFILSTGSGTETINWTRPAPSKLPK